MKIDDIFTGYKIGEPVCLFCKGNLNKWNLSNTSDIVEYYCSECNETFSIVYYEGKEKYFFFSIKDYEVFLSLEKEKFTLSLEYNKSKPIWFPYLGFNFKDKNKLFNKLKKYLLFS